MRRVRPRDGRDRSPRCATTTSTGRGCRATRPTPGVASIFRSALAAGRAPRVFEDGAPAPRLRARPRRRRAPTCWRSRPASPGAFNVRQRHAAQRGGDGRARSPARSTPSRARRHRRVARRRRPPRVRLADARRAELGFRAVEDFEAGHARVREREAARMTPIRRRRPRRVDRVRALHARARAGRDHRRHRVVLRGRGQRRGRRRPARQALRRRRLLHHARRRRARPALARQRLEELGVRVHAAPRDGHAALGLRPPRRRRRAHDLDRRRAPRARTAPTTCRGSGSTAPTPSSSPAATTPRCARPAARGCSSPRRAPPSRSAASRSTRSSAAAWRRAGGRGGPRALQLHRRRRRRRRRAVQQLPREVVGAVGRVALADDRDRPLAVVVEVDEAPALHVLARSRVDPHPELF